MQIVNKLSTTQILGCLNHTKSLVTKKTCGDLQLHQKKKHLVMYNYLKILKLKALKVGKRRQMGLTFHLFLKGLFYLICYISHFISILCNFWFVYNFSIFKVI
jgi:hypothetical protein